MEFLYYYWGYLIVLLMILLSTLVSRYIRRTYENYASQSIESSLSGRQATEHILSRNGINDVSIVPIDGMLTDSYSQKNKMIYLSRKNFDESSIATVAVAAHEAGHAIQVKEKYTFMTFLVVLKPLVSLASYMFVPILLLGTMANITTGTNLIFYLFAAIFAMQMLMLPVEFNASKRALEELGSSGILNEEELFGAKKMLRAAALSYVSTALMALVFMLRFRRK